MVKIHTLPKEFRAVGTGTYTSTPIFISALFTVGKSSQVTQMFFNR